MNGALGNLLQENGLFVLVLLVLVIGFLFLRTRGTKLTPLDEFNALIVAGQPVVAELYSNT